MVSLATNLLPAPLLLLLLLSSRPEHLGWRGRFPKPSLHPERVGPGQGGGEAGEEVEAAHQEGRVAEGGDRGGRGVVECQGGGATPGDVHQGVVTCSKQY